MSLTKTVTVNSVQSRFWGLTTFFNPLQYSRRRLLYRIFREKTKQQGLRLLTVELAFGDAPFELQRRDAEILIQIRAGNDGVMWQKERLLNIGLSYLPPECNSFAWLDCDVMFDNPNWIAETSQLLKRYALVQPFAVSVRLPPGKTAFDVRDANAPSFERGPSAACAYVHADPLVDYMLSGHTGLAWAARRSLFDDIGFYDKMIVGGGDVVLTSGFFGRMSHRFTHLLPETLVADQRKWMEKMAARVAGSVTFANGGLLHLWHGHPRRRQTAVRFHLLTKHSFDPASDIQLNPDGCFAWAGDKPELQRSVARFFWIRNEDGYRLREFVYRAMDGFGDVRRACAKKALTQFHGTKVALATALRFVFKLPEAQKMTLVVTNWKRPQVLEQIIAAYSSYGIIGDIIVWNNNPESSLDTAKYSKVKTVTCKYDAGLDSRWAAGALADREHLLIHDDDLILSEKSLEFLFARYLRMPHLIHGIGGRKLDKNSAFTEAFGRVDLVSAQCAVMNKRYIPEYFKRVALCDDLRNHGRGDGEDVVMNYIVRSVTGEKNLAYAVSHINADDDPAISISSIRRRPRIEFVGGIVTPLESARNEIARRCMGQLTGERPGVRIDDYAVRELGRLFPASWSRYYQTPEVISRQENFSLSENVDRDKFAYALSLLCRRAVLWNERASGQPLGDLA